MAKLTRATPEVPYPFTTKVPVPAMMPWDTSSMQSIDTPADHRRLHGRPNAQLDPAPPIWLCSRSTLRTTAAWRNARTCSIGLRNEDSPWPRNPASTRKTSDSPTRRRFWCPTRSTRPEASERLESLDELCPLGFSEYVIRRNTGRDWRPLRWWPTRLVARRRLALSLSFPRQRSPTAIAPLPCGAPATLLDVAGLAHKDFLEGLKFAPRMGLRRARRNAKVKGDYVLHDQDIVELHM